MHTKMVPYQVKSQKIQVGVQVSRLKDKDVIFSIGSTLEVFILFVFVLDRNIVDTLIHEKKWTDIEDEIDSKKVQAVSFYLSREPVEPLEWKALENRLRPSIDEPPKKVKLLKVLKNHKGAITWSIADIKGIDSSFCTHKIIMKDEFKPAVQPQRRANPNIKEVVKKKVIKLLDAGLIYPISDSP
ncbi:hypothetical protein Tco_1448762 [Tanacetum coccineum]